MGNTICFKKSVHPHKINIIAPDEEKRTQFLMLKSKFSKSEALLTPKKELNITRSFIQKFNFEESNEKDFRENFFPSFFIVVFNANYINY